MDNISTMKNEKKAYVAPRVKVVKFRVERGFAESLHCLGNNRVNNDLQIINDQEDNCRHYGATDFGSSLSGSDYGWN